MKEFFVNAYVSSWVRCLFVFVLMLTGAFVLMLSGACVLMLTNVILLFISHSLANNTLSTKDHSPVPLPLSLISLFKIISFFCRGSSDGNGRRKFVSYFLQSLPVDVHS